MELTEIEPRNHTDKIVESMSEANADDDGKAEVNTNIAPIFRPILQTEAELMLEPEPISPPIPDHDTESIYDDPYSTHIYHNYGGTRAFAYRNSSNDQSGNRKWSLSCLIIGVLIGLVIGATVTGLSMHFTKPPVCATLQTASPLLTTTPPYSTEVYGELNSLLLIDKPILRFNR